MAWLESLTGAFVGSWVGGWIALRRYQSERGVDRRIAWYEAMLAEIDSMLLGNDEILQMLEKGTGIAALEAKLDEVYRNRNRQVLLLVNQSRYYATRRGREALLRLSDEFDALTARNDLVHFEQRIAALGNLLNVTAAPLIDDLRELMRLGRIRR